MLRDLERTPVLSQDGLVLSKKVQREIRRLANKLGPVADTIEQRWKRRLRTIFDEPLDAPRMRALAAMNLGAWIPLLSSGNFVDFLENVEYHSRRLAKLDVAPSQVLAALSAYKKVLTPQVKKLLPNDHAQVKTALDHLYYTIQQTLNNAYYQVRDLEATAFYDVLQNQLESLNVQDLLHRVLETLTQTFRANGGVILLASPNSNGLRVHAWKGMPKSRARCFNTKLGKGLGGEAALSCEAITIVGAPDDPRVSSKQIRDNFDSIWSVPLSLHGKVIGVVQLAFEREYHCLPRELKLFLAIAERCALAIEKARLNEELKEREERIRELGERMMKVEEEERRRISRELHDEVGQSLLLVRLNMEMVQTGLADDDEDKQIEAIARLDETRTIVEQTIVEMRRLISALQPSVLRDLGLPASIRQFVKNIGKTFPGRVKVDMVDVDELPEGTKIMTYRLVQECFTNAVKHSKAKHVDVKLSRKNGHVQLRMEDDGSGFKLSKSVQKRESFGLAGMRERVALLGGDIDINTAPGQGTRVSIAIPV